MASFNRVVIMGNLGQDPELRYTPKGMAIAKLGLAVNRTWKSESGEQKEETTFVDIDAFGKQAETIGQYLKKGRPVMIEGRLRHRHERALDDAVAGAIRRFSGDHFIWDRKAGVDLSPLVAATLARWAFTSAPQASTPGFVDLSEYLNDDDW